MVWCENFPISYDEISDLNVGASWCVTFLANCHFFYNLIFIQLEVLFNVSWSCAAGSEICERPSTGFHWLIGSNVSYNSHVPVLDITFFRFLTLRVWRCTHATSPS